MHKEYKQALGQVLKARRKQEKLSQRKLGLMVGMTRHTIGRIERGSANPTLDVMLRMAQGLDISLAVVIRECERSLLEPDLRPGNFNFEMDRAAPGLRYSSVRVPNDSGEAQKAKADAD